MTLLTGGGSGGSEIFTDDDWSKLDTMMGVDEGTAAATGDAGGASRDAVAASELLMEVRGRFASASMSLQEDASHGGQHSEVLGSSALGVATCVRMHTGRWEVGTTKHFPPRIQRK
jgi:hypothetical protein